MNIIRRNIPNAITCLNVLSGCVAIIFAFHSTRIYGSLTGMQCAWIAIGVAAVADFFDGFMARLLKAYSPLGKELDSLCDLVSFGVAPAMMVYNLSAGSPDSPCWLPWMSLLIPVAGALRLAKFNIDTRQTTSFIGLPIPANAIFWIGYTALAGAEGTGIAALTSPYWLLPVIVLESWLMVFPLPMFSLKFAHYSLRDNRLRYFLLLAAVILIICTGVAGLLWTILLYLLLSLFSK
ncbi:MAG: CDP-diacylglycerol--serine O-phosphatidyltransferase [Muribaculaceae bacterium]|nr:CDP-diacylglycerol--serine O-phosphatidyltransferase [Muribaculaceae bacterium]